MTRSQLLFVVILNTVISLAIALAVTWAVDARRPDPEELASLATPASQLAVIAATATLAAPPAQATTETTPQSAPPTDTPATVQQIEHVVQAGETLAVIAAKYGSTADAVVKANNLTNPDLLYVGQRLLIPITGASAPLPTPVTAANGSASSNTGLRVRSLQGANDLAAEAVEIVNESDQPANLQGWRVQKEGGPEYVFGEMFIFPGQGIRLFSGSGVDDTIKRYWNQSAAVWQSGATVRLIDPQGNIINSYQAP
jgi:LysM repeat protein